MGSVSASGVLRGRGPWDGPSWESCGGFDASTAGSEASKRKRRAPTHTTHPKRPRRRNRGRDHEPRRLVQGREDHRQPAARPRQRRRNRGVLQRGRTKSVSAAFDVQYLDQGIGNFLNSSDQLQNMKAAWLVGARLYI